MTDGGFVPAAPLTLTIDRIMGELADAVKVSITATANKPKRHKNKSAGRLGPRPFESDSEQAWTFPAYLPGVTFKIKKGVRFKYIVQHHIKKDLELSQRSARISQTSARISQRSRPGTRRQARLETRS